MLAELSIQSIALIESVQLQFGKGLITFTGETGAGKSILLDAIGLILGDRADTNLIRTDAQTAFVEALFILEEPHHDWLKETLVGWGIDLEDNQLLIAREVHRTGRTVCRVNGKMVTVQMLRTLADKLVERHGQHETYALCRPEEQIRVLDLYGLHEETLKQVRRSYQHWKSLHDQRIRADMDEQERMRRLDMLEFQIEEIESANLMVGEEDTLRAERKRLQNAGRIQSIVQSAIQALSGDELQQGAVDHLSEAASQVEDGLAFDNALGDVNSLLNTALVHAQEAVRELESRLGLIDDDPLRLEEVDNRLAVIRSLERKYGNDIEAILHHLETAQQEHRALMLHEENIHQLESQVAVAEEELQHWATLLHDQRIQAAERLSVEIESTLQGLNMPSATFQILVEAERPCSAAGFDTVTFMFSANKGETMRPLGKVASGGELSRLLLGIKSVLAAVDDVGCMVFDEIDAGVSGHAVERIAERLQQLSRDRQVLCVTHSAQVAASATSHYLIEKFEDKNRTKTTVTVLDDLGRTAEISRLIGGSVSDDTALAHAAALLKKVGTAIRS